MSDPHRVAAILDNSRRELAEAITNYHYQLHPELTERFGPAGRSHCRQDAEYHLSYLAAAVAAGTPAFFTEYVGWCKAMLGARRIAADDLAENLRTLREILERSLPPDLCTLAVSPVNAGLAELARVSTAPSSRLDGDGGPLAQLAHDYLSALLRTERHLASSLILAAADAGTPIRELYLQNLPAEPARDRAALADESDQRGPGTLLHRSDPTHHVAAIPVYLLRGEEEPDIGRGLRYGRSA